MAKLKLTPRDFEILEFLYQHKVVKKCQIRNKFFPNTSRQRVGIRLNQLFKFNLINKTMLYGKKCSYQAYSLKSEGLKLLNRQNGNALSGGKMKSDSPFHDVQLVEIRNVFDRLQACNEYITENSLTGDQRLNSRLELLPFKKVRSDSAVYLNIRGKNFFAGIELEVSLKSEERYAAKVREFYSNSVPGVLYICGSPKIENVLGKVDKVISKELGSPPLLSFTTLEKINSKPNKLTFEDYNGDVIIIE